MSDTDTLSARVREWADRREALIESQLAEFLSEPDLPAYCALYVRDTYGLRISADGPMRQHASCTTNRLRGQSEAEIREQARLLGGPAELYLLRGEWSPEPWPEVDPPEQTHLTADPLFAACGLTLPTYTSGTSYVQRDLRPRVYRWDLE